MIKHKQHQSGFGLLGIILPLVIISLVGGAYLVVSNKSEQPSSENSSTPKPVNTTEESTIQLQNIGLQTMEDIEVDKYAVREFESDGLKGFYVFGEGLSGGRINPTFEYASIRQGAIVVSAIDGIVAFIKEQPDTNDFEVFIQPKEGSIWTVGYDHLTNVAVEKGSAIKAGDAIGEPAIQNNGLYRFEIQINKDENGITTHYCPSTLLDSDVKEKTLAELTSMQNKWELITGIDALYDVEAQDPIGCMKKTLTSTEAEGR